jgi:hypothetical protein
VRERGGVKKKEIFSSKCERYKRDGTVMALPNLSIK